MCSSGIINTLLIIVPHRSQGLTLDTEHPNPQKYTCQVWNKLDKRLSWKSKGRQTDRQTETPSLLFRLTSLGGCSHIKLFTQWRRTHILDKYSGASFLLKDVVVFSEFLRLLNSLIEKGGKKYSSTAWDIQTCPSCININTNIPAPHSVISLNDLL